MTLAALAKFYGTDKLSHDYCPLYERHLHEPRSILEIGIATGASLRMWEARFPLARVMGVDVDPTCCHDDVECHRGDAILAGTYSGWLPDHLGLVVDDGSHQARDVVETFALLWWRVAFGGWYVIEDLACVRHPQFGGDEAGGPVLALLDALALYAIRGWAELHVYEEIAFARRLADPVPSGPRGLPFRAMTSRHET